MFFLEFYALSNSTLIKIVALRKVHLSKIMHTMYFLEFFQNYVVTDMLSIFEEGRVRVFCQESIAI